MAYKFTNSKGVKYYLHFKDVNLKGGRQQRIYYFARDIRDGVLEAVPGEYKVVETERSGMPILMKSITHSPNEIPPNHKKLKRKKKKKV